MQEVLPPEPSPKEAFGHKWQPGVSGNPNGRPAGEPNKITKQLRAAIMEALDLVSGGDGGVGYLMSLALTKPEVFARLLGQTLPLKVEGGLQFHITAIRETVVDPANDGT